MLTLATTYDSDACAPRSGSSAPDRPASCSRCCCAAGDRLRRARDPRPRVRRAAGARRPARAEHRRRAARGRRRRPARPRGPRRTTASTCACAAAASTSRLTELTGRKITIYGQQEVVKDLIAALARTRGGQIHFEVDDVAVARPRVRRAARSPARRGRRRARARLRRHRRLRRLPRRLPRRDPRRRADRARLHYPFGWLGILAEAPPTHRRADLRLARARLRAALDALADDQPASTSRSRPTRTSSDGRTSGSGRSCRRRPRIGWSVNDGPILEKGITPMRSFVAEPMQHGRLVPGRRRRPHRPAHRRQGPQPRGQRRAPARPPALRRFRDSGDDGGSTRYSADARCAASGARRTSPTT